MAPHGCALMDEYAEEFALGLLDGAERAKVVAHLERCRACGTRVALLAEAGEHLLLLAPEVEPSVGFEQRVLEQLGQVTAPVLERRRRRRWLGTVAGVAAAFLVAVGGAALVMRAVGPDGSKLNTLPEERADLVSSRRGRDVGDAVLVASNPERVELDVAEWMKAIDEWEDPPVGPWTMVVERADGSKETYPVPLEDDGTPRITLDDAGSPVRSVALADGVDHIWCAATFE
jgi:hypothetical protein